MPATPITPAVATRAFRPGADDAAVWALMLATHEAGDLPGTTRHDIETFRDRLAIDPAGRIVATEDDLPVGIVIPAFQYLAVHPAHRRRGHGTRLVAAALELARERGEPRVLLGVPLGDARAEAFARASGLAYASSLWSLALAPEVVVPEPAFPAGYVTRAFRAGEDEERFVALFNAAFAEHPTPLQVTLEGVRHVHALPGFDPATIVLAFHASDPQTPAGFCRVATGGAETAELEFVGVAPAHRGSGLGRALLRWGIHTLRRSGAREVVLFVEAENQHALAIYERAGFVRRQEWPRWGRAVE